MTATYRICSFLFAGVLLTGAALAQSPTFYDPDYISPWGAPASPAEQDPTAPPPATPPPGTDTYYVPVAPTPGATSPGNIDFFYDEDDPFGGAGGVGGTGGFGSGRSEPYEPKDSIQILGGASSNICRRWGAWMLGDREFPDRGVCEAALDRVIDGRRTEIDQVHDRFERLKLQRRLRNEIRREDAARYTVNFEVAKTSLREASRQGCSCLEPQP